MLAFSYECLCYANDICLGELFLHVCGVAVALHGVCVVLYLYNTVHGISVLRSSGKNNVANIGFAGWGEYNLVAAVFEEWAHAVSAYNDGYALLALFVEHAGYLLH